MPYIESVRRAWADCRGMTLIELMVALVFLTLAAAIALNILVAAMAWNRLAADQTRAVAYGTEVMEELKVVPQRLPALAGETYSPALGNWSRLGIGVEGSSDGLMARVGIEPYDAQAGLFEVRVEITWDFRGKQRKINLVTLMAGD